MKQNVHTHWSRILYSDISAARADATPPHRSGATALRAVIVTAINQWIATGRRARARYRQRRDAMATRQGLCELDDRTLRDLGFGRSEIQSVVAEAMAGAEWTFLRTRSLHR